MNTKQLLFLLVFAPLIFSCKKNDDYRDAFEGVYDVEVIGFLYLIDADKNTIPLEPIVYKTPVTVRKLSSRELAISIESETMTAIVDEDGKLSISPETGVLPMTDETSIIGVINLTITYTGYITGKILYIKESYSGTASITDNGKVLNLDVGGSAVYNGTKE